MKRRSMLMRLLGLCGFAAPGLNAVAETISSNSDGPGWIGLAIVGECKHVALTSDEQRLIGEWNNQWVGCPTTCIIFEESDCDVIA